MLKGPSLVPGIKPEPVLCKASLFLTVLALWLHSLLIFCTQPCFQQCWIQQQEEKVSKPGGKFSCCLQKSFLVRLSLVVTFPSLQKVQVEIVPVKDYMQGLQ